MKTFPVCPQCSADPSRVMYAGLPMWLCSRESCSCAWGIGAWLTQWLPFNGWFVEIHPAHGYWRTLWWWLISKEREE
jgi:hypothetical protein